MSTKHPLHFHIGRFNIDATLINDEPHIVREILKELEAVVLSAEYRFDTNAVHYLALSEKFDKISPGERAPRYTIDFQDQFDARDNWTGLTVYPRRL